MDSPASGLPVALSSLGRTGGEPAIVLPGGPCRGPEYLGDLAGVGEERPLVVMHPRGTRRSGGLSRGWWRDAADVVAMADALELDEIDVVAHSAGSRLALAAAAQYPIRIRSLALVTPPATWLTGTPSDVEAVAGTGAEAPALEALAAMAADDPETEEAFRASFRRQAPAGYAHWAEAERAHADVGEVSLAAALAWFTDIPDDAGDRIRAAHPTRILVVGGDRDLLTGVQPVRDYAALLGGRLEMIADCGHYPWVERPDEFRRALVRWLRGDI